MPNCQGAMVNYRSLQQIAEHMQTQTQTLIHALQQEGDLQLLMEVSYEISLLASQFRDQILAEAVGELSMEKQTSTGLGDHPSD